MFNRVLLSINAADSACYKSLTLSVIHSIRTNAHKSSARSKSIYNFSTLKHITQAKSSNSLILGSLKKDNPGNMLETWLWIEKYIRDLLTRKHISHRAFSWAKAKMLVPSISACCPSFEAKLSVKTIMNHHKLMSLDQRVSGQSKGREQKYINLF